MSHIHVNLTRPFFPGSRFLKPELGCRARIHTGPRLASLEKAGVGHLGNGDPRFPRPRPPTKEETPRKEKQRMETIDTSRAHHLTYSFSLSSPPSLLVSFIPSRLLTLRPAVLCLFLPCGREEKTWMRTAGKQIMSVCQVKKDKVKLGCDQVVKLSRIRCIMLSWPLA